MSRSNNLAGGVYNEGDNTFTLPTTRGADAYVLTRDNTADSNSGKGTTWKQTELAPSTTSISPTEVESGAGGNITFTLTGVNYALSGMTVNFLATSGSNITSGMTVTHTSGTSLSVEIARSAFADASEPYSVKVAKASGLDHTLDNAVRVDNAPSFTASPNTVVATVYESIDNDTHYTIAATDAESDAITYEEVGATLYDEFTSATPRGVQSDGTIKGVPDVVTTESQETTFTVRAKSTGDGGATEKQTDQAFKFIIKPTPQLFAGKTYTGNSSSQSPTFDETYNDSSSTARNFQPDLLWIKNRGLTKHHRLVDSVRGSSWHLASNLANAESEQTTMVTALNSNGFSVGSSDNVNDDDLMSWGWKAGGAPSGSLGTINATTPSGAGTITQSSDSGYSLIQNATDLTQSVNQDSGFSITKFKGSANGCTIPHNLGGTPEWFMIKNLDQSQSWACWHKNLSAKTQYRISLDLANAELQESPAGSGKYFPTEPNSTTITCGSDDGQGGSTDEFICYAWKGVSGLSSFGTYEGNGSNPTERTIVTGFRPRFVMVKNIDSSGQYWATINAFSQPGQDTVTKQIYADLTNAEDTGTHKTMTFSSTGFGFTTASTYSSINENGKTFIYIAFA